MVEAWYAILGLMLTVYVVLDGRNFGVGALHLIVAKTRPECRQVIAAIGPLWTWHEVWLVAAGGVIFMAFPRLLAAASAADYLSIFLVLWSLILRGIALEVSGHIADPLWQSFWDFVFALSNVLLAVLFGVALGNVVRGGPFDATGNFFEPLLTNFSPHGETGILDWYTVLVGMAALAALALHGATWIAYRADGDLGARALRCTSALFWVVALLTAAITATSFRLLPRLAISFRVHPWGFSFPLLAVGGLGGIPLWDVVTGKELATPPGSIAGSGGYGATTLATRKNDIDCSTGKTAPRESIPVLAALIKACVWQRNPIHLQSISRTGKGGVGGKGARPPLNCLRTIPTH